MEASTLGLELNTERYIALMTKLIGEAEHLQDNPPRFIPQENRAIQHLLEALEPYSTNNGGPLIVEHVVYVEGRGNLVIGYTPPSATNTIAFIGSHLDVVPADPETWDYDPFKLTIKGDILYGRGTTDCLGHVALLTDMFIQLAEKKPDLKREVWAVFIAAEESTAISGVGVDALMKYGRLDMFRNGPIYWIDMADLHPCIGTAAVAMWTLKAEGHSSKFHSGEPNKGINSVELASEAVAYIQKKFYSDFPPHEKEAEYKYATPSTMKPTQIKCSDSSVNELPSWAQIQGDIRLTPFYDIEECVKKLKGYIDEINDDFSLLPTRGPCSKYEVTDTNTGESFKAKLSFKTEGDPFKGVACDTTSEGYKHLDAATTEVLGESKPYSICGGIPLAGDLQIAGFDIQMSGYGHSHVAHTNNEYCTVTCMQSAMRIFSRVLDKYNQ